MKYSNSTFQKIVFPITLIAFLFFLSSCSKKIYFSNSAVVPAAQGYVQMKKDKNGNYNLNISIVNLAPPQRLQPAAVTYQVWMETDQNGTKNLGKIITSDNLLSKTLKASFSSVTPFRPTRIYITAENEAAVANPGSMSV